MTYPRYGYADDLAEDQFLCIKELEAEIERLGKCLSEAHVELEAERTQINSLMGGIVDLTVSFDEATAERDAERAYAQRSREVLAFIAKFAQQMCQEDSPDPREWHDDMNYIAVIAERGTISDDQRQGADSPYVATIDPSEAQTSMAASNKTPPSPAIPAGDAHSTVRPGHPDVPVTGHIPQEGE